MEYLILDSNDNWYLTTTDRAEAFKMLKEIEEARENGHGYGIADEIGEDVWLFEAKTISSI